MPQTSARPQERDRLRKRAVSFALLCAAGHILLPSGERAACLHTGRKLPLRRSYARRGISCRRPMSAPPALRTGRESPLRHSYALRGISCCRPMSAPFAPRTGRESPLRRSYALRGISCSRPVCAPPASRTGRESPLRRRFTSERMTKGGDAVFCPSCGFRGA